MKRILFVTIISIIFISTNLFPKNNPKEKEDSLLINLWVPTAAAGANVSQLSLTNWSQGGDNSITWTLIGNLGLKYLTDNWHFRNHLKAAYGRTKIGGENFRTNENELYFESVLSRKVGWAVDPFLSNTVRTSITKGFNYKKKPPVETVDFFDPGYISQSIGFTYDKLIGFKTRLGFAVQETFTNEHREYTDDTSTTYMDAFKFETGLESVSNAELKIDDNILLKSNLRLFTRYESLDVWDVRWDNALIAKVSDYINVNLSVLMIYEKKQSLKTQLKQALQLGLTYTII